MLLFCRDLENSLPVSLLSDNQNFVEVKFATADLIAGSVDNGGGGVFTAPKVAGLEMYINNIYMLPEVRELYIKRNQFMMIKVNLLFTEIVNKPNGRINLSRIKFPVEILYVAFRPNENTTFLNDWYKNSKLTQVNVPTPAIDAANVLIVSNIVYQRVQNSVDVLGLRAQGIDLYHKFTPGFYEYYMPTKFSNIETIAPSIEGNGNYILPFAFKPGQYQQFGYAVFSQMSNDEVYLEYESSVISASTPTTAIIGAKSINFIRIKNGSAIIKFVT